MTVILLPSKSRTVNQKTLYNIVRIVTDGNFWILTHTYGETKRESRDDYPEMRVM